MKEVDDTPVTESISEEDAMMDLLARWEWADGRVARLATRVTELEHALALLQEERETVRAPEATDDPEWYA